MDRLNESKAVMEGLLFVSGDEGIDAKTIAEILEVEEASVLDMLHEMQKEFKESGRGLQIIEIAGAFQLTTLPEHAVYFERLASSPTHATLSQAALETLAIIAYKQPITRAEIEDIRGVKCEKAINTLMSKKLIQERGRAETAGRPILYGTTKEFMDYFGLKSINDLPPMPSIAVDEEVEQEVDLIFQKLKEKA
ncbi:SMC-Scp complex subunit ScpB [Ammoniphilus sp. CFH 90114]|uniref:SMC-Scp complex subunit ScpB n=1 Tax=Ammoniphilus sp. CFH 90114 TaxID=2493665 RepID=UPI00100E0DF6|nr:SMC-Scp complex subunit ScpB [Ammoniphilus sp. CFH 90114]RXT13847.1 SMC-Scp complex subunit ScpB [Ammoniphilus sp. CFH 90114]